jgi:hypothetical protein
MAQQVIVQLVDDLDGTSSDDIATVQFSVDGVTYEIDLTSSNADQLRDAVADYVANARRTGGRVKRGTRSANGSRSSANGEAGQIREWAQANDIELAARGRIPAHVVESYREAKADAAGTSAAPKRRSRAKRS